MKKIISLLGLPEGATEEQVLAAIEALLSDIETLRAASKGLPKGVSAAAIAEKVSAGMTVGQAVEVLAAQAQHDKTKPHDPLPGEEAPAKKGK